MALTYSGVRSRQEGEFRLTEEIYELSSESGEFLFPLFLWCFGLGVCWLLPLLFILPFNEPIRVSIEQTAGPSLLMFVLLWIIVGFPFLLIFLLAACYFTIHYWFRKFWPKRRLVKRELMSDYLKRVEADKVNEANLAKASELERLNREAQKAQAQAAEAAALARKAKEAEEREAMERDASRQRVQLCSSVKDLSPHTTEPLVYSLPQWWWPAKTLGLALVDVAPYGQLPPQQIYDKYMKGYRTVGANVPQRRGIYLQGMARRTTLNEALVVLPTELPGTSPQNCVMFILDDEDRVLYLHNPSRRETYYAPDITPQLRKEEAQIKIELALPFLQSLYVDAIMGGDPNLSGGGWT